MAHSEHKQTESSTIFYFLTFVLYTFVNNNKKNAYKTHIVRISVKTVNKEKKFTQASNERPQIICFSKPQKKNGMRRIEFLHCMKKSLQIYEQIKAVYIHFASLYMYMIKYLKRS